MSKAQVVPQVRVYQRGHKWWYDIRLEGRRIRRPGGRSRNEAQASGAQFLASGAQRSPAGTLGAILDSWVAYQSIYGRKERTVKTTTNCCERLKVHFGADRQLIEIDTDALAGFVRWRQSGERKVGAYAINRDLATIRAAWRHAHEDGKAPEPPRFRLLTTDEPNPKPVMREEFALLMLHADRRLKAIFALAGVLGLRNSEIRRLKWRDVDLINRRLRVDMLHSKNRSERTLPIPGAVLEILQEHRADRSESGPSDLIFVNRFGRMYTDYGLAKVARHVWEQTGLLEDRPGTKVLHDLRATAATFMVEAGASTETLRSNLGWKSRDVVERYVKAFEQSRSKAVEAVADALL
ncbi:MAG: site-specific integrase [bacterium]|nr:site-specific integrase [bacterium]